MMKGLSVFRCHLIFKGELPARDTAYRIWAASGVIERGFVCRLRKGMVHGIRESKFSGGRKQR
jgi:hypothetical protein